MKAWVIDKITEVGRNNLPLKLVEIPVPEPGPGKVRIKISVCGVCHTELDEIEGRTPPASFPVIPGHQVVGRIDKTGIGVSRWKPDDRVGVAWIFSACGKCRYCLSNRENLCEEFTATGRDHNGGYAEYMVADENFCFGIPESIEDKKAAPLFCAGAIGYRSVILAGVTNGSLLGLSGFGASAHLVMKMIRFNYPGMKVYVFARSNAEKNFARQLGAVWAGDYDETPPQKLDAIIDTTPAWKPVIKSLECLSPGGRLVINAIRKQTDDQNLLSGIKYQDHLWMEKEIKSVANVTRNDVTEFLALAVRSGISPETRDYGFMEANNALIDMKEGRIRGAKILII
jgi:alcohol dehydrogenase, propanol-preferring